MRSLHNVVKAFQVSVGAPRVVQRAIKASEIIGEAETEVGGYAEDSAESKKQHVPKVNVEAIKQRIVGMAQEEADEIIANARNTAKNIIEDARREIEDIKKIVLQEAKEQGYQDGYAEVASKAEMLLQEAEDIKAQAIEQYNTTLIETEPEMIGVILDITRKIIGDELAERPDRISQLVKQTLAACMGATSVTVKVSPEDYEAVLENKDKIVRQSRFSGEVAIVKDMSLEKSDCVIETPVGNIDASVEVQLQTLEQAFLNILENRE